MGDLSRINTNVAALNSLLNLSNVNSRILQSQSRISSGLTVSRASDGPANYFISKTLTKDINELVTFQRNIERGINFLETQDSKLAQVVNIILEMTDLVNQANSIAVSSAEKVAIQQQLHQFTNEMREILISGVSQKLFTPFNIGNLEDVKLTGTSALNAMLMGFPGNGLYTPNITGSSRDINLSLRDLNIYLNNVLQMEQTLASYIQRLEYEQDNFETEEVNTRSSLSTIVDSDLAQEQVELTKLQILQQSTIIMLAQANAAPGAILSLF